MALLGMPSPVLWGVLGGLLNFVPYLGALVTVAILAAVGFVQFDTVGQALLPALVYWVLTILESSLITPLLLVMVKLTPATRALTRSQPGVPPSALPVS